MVNIIFEEVYKYFLMESLSYDDAIKIFEKYSGKSDIAKLSSNELDKLRRSLILKFHPDRNQGEEIEGTRKVSEINTAYEILSNKNKRKYSNDFSTSNDNTSPYDPENIWSWAGYNGGVPNILFTRLMALFLEIA